MKDQKRTVIFKRGRGVWILRRPTERAKPGLAPTQGARRRRHLGRQAPHPQGRAGLGPSQAAPGVAQLLKVAPSHVCLHLGTSTQAIKERRPAGLGIPESERGCPPPLPTSPAALAPTLHTRALTNSLTYSGGAPVGEKGIIAEQVLPSGNTLPGACAHTHRHAHSHAHTYTPALAPPCHSGHCPWPGSICLHTRLQAPLTPLRSLRVSCGASRPGWA